MPQLICVSASVKYSIERSHNITLIPIFLSNNMQGLCATIIQQLLSNVAGRYNSWREADGLQWQCIYPLESRLYCVDKHGNPYLGIPPELQATEEQLLKRRAELCEVARGIPLLKGLQPLEDYLPLSKYLGMLFFLDLNAESGGRPEYAMICDCWGRYTILPSCVLSSLLPALGALHIQTPEILDILCE